MRQPRTLLLVVLVLLAALVVSRVLRAPGPPAANHTIDAVTALAKAAPVRTAGPASAIPDLVAHADGVPGSTATAGCGDGLWEHVYHPARLLVTQDCVTVTGIIVDATANLKHPRRDGVRKEEDGDTHGWLQVDPEFANLINDGNREFEGGNLVFEIVCHWKPTQADARPACADTTGGGALPPVGSHVAITGTLVLDTNHGRWNEIHPVSSIVAR